MKSLRSYLTYIPLSQKIVQFVLMPLLGAARIAVVAVMFDQLLREEHPNALSVVIRVVLTIYLLYAFVICDVIFDRSNFGGTFSSKSTWLEYMKSSPRGLQFYRDLLRCSMVVRFLYAVLVTGMYWLFLVIAGLEAPGSALAMCVFYIGGTYLSMQFGSLLTRFFASEQTSLMTGVVCAMLVSGLFSVTAIILNVRAVNEGVVYFCVGLLAMLAGILLAYMLVVIGTRKKEKEYYDI